MSSKAWCRLPSAPRKSECLQSRSALMCHCTLCQMHRHWPQEVSTAAQRSEILRDGSSCKPVPLSHDQ